jgi:hypothetical protein
LIGFAIHLAGAGLPAWVGLAAFAAHLGWQIGRLKIDDPALCLRVFKSNRDAGLLLFAGLLVNALIAAGLERQALVPRDDLAFAAMHVGRIERAAAAATYQESRTARADRVVPPSPRRGLANLVFQELGQREDVAPHPPGGRELVAVRTHAKRDRQ